MPLDASSAPSCLFDGDDMQLLHVPGASDFTLVTFDVMHARANGRTGFALALARKLGLNLYAVVPTRPNWYPAREAQIVADKIAAAKDRPSLGYGASMGGYGVLKYGRAMGTDATLALSPQATIDPGTNGAADRRYARFHDACAHAGMQVTAADTGPNSYVITDPGFAPDAFQRDLLADLAMVIDLPHVGHRAAVGMTPSANALRNFIDALDGRTTALTRRLRKASKGSLQYKMGLTQAALTRGDGAAALAEISHAIQHHGPDDEAKVLHARACLLEGTPKAALPDIRAMVAEKPHQVTYRRLLADLYDAAGQPAQAIAELATAVEQSENGVLAVQLWRQLNKHQPTRAERFARHARKRWPERAAQFAA